VVVPLRLEVVVLLLEIQPLPNQRNESLIAEAQADPVGIRLRKEEVLESTIGDKLQKRWRSRLSKIPKRRQRKTLLLLKVHQLLQMAQLSLRPMEKMQKRKRRKKRN